jgi:hypothetical protein
VTLAQPLGCLLDEDLDPALAEPLADALDWRVTSVRAEGWLGVKNGPLLQAMADAHLQVLVTGDRGLYPQRRAQLLALGIGVVLVRDPARAAERLGAMARAVIGVHAGQLIEVEASPPVQP